MAGRVNRNDVKPTQTSDSEVTLTPAEAEKVRRGIKQLKDGRTLPWRQVRRELGL